MAALVLAEAKAQEIEERRKAFEAALALDYLGYGAFVGRKSADSTPMRSEKQNAATDPGAA